MKRKKNRAGYIIIKLHKRSSKEKIFRNIENKTCYAQGKKD